MSSAGRLNVQFNSKQNNALAKLADDLETTKSGVLKRALALLDIVVREKKHGNSVGIINDGKEIKEIVGIFE